MPRNCVYVESFCGHSCIQYRRQTKISVNDKALVRADRALSVCFEGLSLKIVEVNERTLGLKNCLASENLYEL